MLIIIFRHEQNTIYVFTVDENAISPFSVVCWLNIYFKFITLIIVCCVMSYILVPQTGVEPVQSQWLRDFKSLVSTNSTIRANTWSNRWASSCFISSIMTLPINVTRINCLSHSVVFLMLPCFIQLTTRNTADLCR